MTTAVMDVEKLAYSPLSYLIRLLARQHFIQFTCRESFKLQKVTVSTPEEAIGD
jgi:hypothetical protein